jgi:hypothetical protein
MNAERRDAERLDAFIDDTLQEPAFLDRDITISVGPDVTRVVSDIRSLAAAPRVEFVAALEQQLIEQAASARAGRPDGNGAVGITLPGIRPAPRRLRTRPLQAAVLVLALMGTAAGLAAFPAVLAQVGRVACFVPNLGIQSCEAPGLVAVGPVSLSHDDATLTVKQVLSSNGETLVRLEIAGLPLAPDLRRIALDEVALALRDEQGREYSAHRRFQYGAPTHINAVTGEPMPGSAQTFRAEWTFAGLDPSVRTVMLAVRGPAPIGEWAVDVAVVPAREAGLTFAAAGSSSASHHGITVSVESVTTDTERTAIRLTARADPPWRRVVNVGGQPSLLNAAYHGPTLRDERGREYERRYTPPGELRHGYDPSGVYTEDRLFAPLAPAVRWAELSVPFVTVGEETPEARLAVSLTEIGVRYDPLPVSLALGAYTAEVTAISIEQHRGRRTLMLDFRLGDWQQGRKLAGVGVTLEGLPLEGMIGYLAGDDVGQLARIGLVLPEDASGDLQLVFKDVAVAVAGPWRLEVPGPAGR